jgi:hypothetical protein
VDRSVTASDGDDGLKIGFYNKKMLARVGAVDLGTGLNSRTRKVTAESQSKKIGISSNSLFSLDT